MCSYEPRSITFTIMKYLIDYNQIHIEHTGLKPFRVKNKQLLNAPIPTRFGCIQVYNKNILIENCPGMRNAYPID